MKKKAIRCFKTFAKVYSGVYNYPVYFITYEGWSGYSFVTCINCGELFVIDWENPKSEGLSIYDIAGSKTCPICKMLLKDTVRDYPKTIRMSNGKFGSYIHDGIIPPDHESLILEFFEISLEEFGAKG